jgi:hypothetical protein
MAKALTFSEGTGGVAPGLPCAVVGEGLTGVQDIAVGLHFAGRLAIEQIVGIDGIQRETVTGVSRCPLAQMARLPNPEFVPEPPSRSAFTPGLRVAIG